MRVPEPQTRPLWAGRAAVLLGILFMAVNLRTAVVGLSPIVGLVSADIPLDSVGLGVLGMLPPIAFAVSGLLAPVLARRVGIETALVLACLAMVAGSTIRALAGGYPVLLVGTIVALAGMGFGNVLLPPAVKKYFPDRIGQVTAGYATLLAFSTSIPALVATPVADLAGWRVSLAVWALFALSALVPWVIVRAQHRAREAADTALVPEVATDLVGRIWHSRVAWALAITFGATALPAYAFFAWLPSLLVEHAGVSPLEAGTLLALFGFVGLPASLFIPGIAVRLHNGVLIVVGVVCFWIGLLGLLLVPTTATWLWVLFLGTGALLFPLCLTLINLRSRTAATSVALSGFVQTIGYGAGALGPLVIGVIHGLVHDWTAPLLFLMGFTLLALIGAVLLARPGTVEDDLARRRV